MITGRPPELGTGDQNPTRLAFLNAIMDMYDTGNAVQTAIQPVPDTLINEARIVSLGGLITEISGQSERFKSLAQSAEFETLLERVSLALGLGPEHEFSVTDKPNKNLEQIRALCLKYREACARITAGMAWLDERWDQINQVPIGVDLPTFQKGEARYRALVDAFYEIGAMVNRLGGRIDEARLLGGVPTHLLLTTRQVEAATKFQGRDVTGAPDACIRSFMGEVWIVQNRTGKNRPEITWSELAEDPIAALRHMETVLKAALILKGTIIQDDGTWQEVKDGIDAREAAKVVDLDVIDLT